MKKFQIFLVVSCFVLLAALDENTGDPKTVSADVSGSRVMFTGKRAGEMQAGYMKLLSGSLKLEENQVKGGSFTMDMNSITDARAQDTKESSALKSPGFFDTKKYPTADFVITDITKLPVKNDGEIKATHRIEGNLTMKGITKKVSFDASVNVLKGKVALSSQPFSIDAGQFGFRDKPENLQVQMEIVTK
jgi:polyisoprenoid-binding protein YceI